MIKATFGWLFLYLPMTQNKDFFAAVYQVIQLIPEGRVTSYGAIANYLGAKQAARMVGWAMNASHRFSDIPAHRVVNRKGLLSGQHHFDTPNQMQSLLEQEGIVVKNQQIQDFEKVFWDPALELEFP